MLILLSKNGYKIWYVMLLEAFASIDMILDLFVGSKK